LWRVLNYRRKGVRHSHAAELLRKKIEKENAMKTVLAILTVLVCADLAHGEIYKWVDEKGNVHFGDKQPAALAAEKVDLQINTYTSVSYDVSIFARTEKVVMYSASWCKYCKKARRYFISRNISFVEYDIDQDARARERYKKMGAKGVPVILYGKKRMNGFSETAFEQMYRGA
jgi:glutaredoxin